MSSLPQTRLNKIRQTIRDRIATNIVIINSGGDDGGRLGDVNMTLASILQLFDKPEEFPTFDDWMHSPWDEFHFVDEVMKESEIMIAKAAFEAGRK
jgi:hypothetical protein